MSIAKQDGKRIGRFPRQRAFIAGIFDPAALARLENRLYPRPTA
jgi:hypothetical protein